MRRLNQESWFGSVGHHLEQFSKGALVSLFTFAGYGLAKRVWGDASVETQGTDLQEQALAFASQKSLAEVVITTSPPIVSAQLPVSAPKEKATQKASAFSSKPVSDTHKHHAESLADELGIAFHEKEAASKEKLSKPTTLIHTTNPENSNTENITIIVGEPFSITIPGYTVGADGKTYFFGTMNATLVDGSPLPPWMHFEPPPTPYTFGVISSVRTGIVRGIAVQRDLALVVDDNSLLLVNISDPRHPKIIGSQAFLRGPFSVAVKGDVAFVAGVESGGLQIVNISDPRHPKIIGQVLQDTGSVALHGNIALVLGSFTNSSGLQLVDISDPQHPRLISTQVLPSSGSVTVQGDMAFVLYFMGHLHPVNISDPQHPKLIHSQALPLGIYKGMSVQGNILSVVDTPIGVDVGGLRLVNISDPQNPKIIGNQVSPVGADGVTMQGDWALVAALSSGLQLVNIMQPSAPRVVAKIKTDSDAYRVVVEKNLAFVGCQNSFKIIDLKTWAWTLRGVAPLTERGLRRMVLVRAHSLPDINYQKTLQVYSSSRPFIDKPISGLSMRPGQILSYRFTNEFLDAMDGILPFVKLGFGQVGDHELPSWLSVSYEPMIGSQILVGKALDVAIQGNLALVAASYGVFTGGLHLVNISTPQRPTLIGSQALSGSPYSVAVQGNLALVTSSLGPGLQLVNISNPKNPNVISSQPVRDSARGLTVRKQLVLVATLFGGLYLVNISNPQHPKFISNQNLPGSPMSVTVKGDVAVVAAGTGLHLVNISNPQYPKLISSQALSGNAYSVVVQEDLALVAADSGGVQLVDISDPHHPKLIGSQVLSGRVSYVAMQGTLAFVVVINSGLQLVNIRHPNQITIMDSIGTLGDAISVTIRDNIAFVATSTGLNIIQYGLSGIVLRGQPTKADHKNYYIVITAQNSDGTVGNTTFRISVNNPPVWKTLIAEKIVNVGQLASFQLPKNVFWDEDGDALTFSSALSNGSPLPDWITFFVEGQIYTIIPSSSNRGRYNISVTVDDGYYGTAQAWFSLIIPTRKPVKASDIPSQNAFIWRPFELLVSSIFMSPDGDALSYHAQLKGARPLPQWLHFDNTTCLTSCHFFGNPGITDLTDLAVELIATGLGGEANAEFSIAMRTSTLFQDLATYYSVSGAGLVVLSLLARLWRWQKMQKIHTVLKTSENVEGADIEESQVTHQTLETCLQSLLEAVERRQTQRLTEQTQLYCQQALSYTKQHQSRTLEIGDPWEVIEKMVKELERRAVYRFNYEATFIWIKTLHQLLKLIIETESGHKHIIIKTSKEHLLEQLTKVEKYIRIDKTQGVEIKQQLTLCREALVSMNDTDSIKDNLFCRDSEMLLEIIKTMVVPPYGMVRLMYQQGNIPSGWYPIIIQMWRLAEQALTNSGKLSDLQIQLSQQKDWRVIYEGVGLLGKVACETQDEKIQKQAIEGIQSQTRGLNYYQNYRGFWGHCSPCCDKQNAWIRARAQEELRDLNQEDHAEDVNVNMRSLSSLSQSLLAINSSPSSQL